MKTENQFVILESSESQVTEGTGDFTHFFLMNKRGWGWFDNFCLAIIIGKQCISLSAKISLLRGCNYCSFIVLFFLG